ncbi:MAG: LysM peptidoglycan-binding domain-containing protein [Planctomycetia bacterium]|nr:LysM peptidoglycan-binding domain-containing protein [Planctomycetia bacterium]
MTREMKLGLGMVALLSVVLCAAIVFRICRPGGFAPSANVELSTFAATVPIPMESRDASMAETPKLVKPAAEVGRTAFDSAPPTLSPGSNSNASSSGNGSESQNRQSLAHDGAESPARSRYLLSAPSTSAEPAPHIVQADAVAAVTSVPRTTLRPVDEGAVAGSIVEADATHASNQPKPTNPLRFDAVAASAESDGGPVAGSASRYPPAGGKLAPPIAAPIAAPSAPIRDNRYAAESAAPMAPCFDTPPPTRPAVGRRYEVREGDTLLSIARFELGDGSRWVEIYQLNRQQMTDDFQYLKPGTILILPGIKHATRAAPANQQ